LSALTIAALDTGVKDGEKWTPMNPKNVHDYEDALLAVMARFDDQSRAHAFGQRLDDIFFDFRDGKAWRILIHWGAKTRPSHWIKSSTWKFGP
jgi:hypothetical protein